MTVGEPGTGGQAGHGSAAVTSGPLWPRIYLAGLPVVLDPAGPLHAAIGAGSLRPFTEGPRRSGPGRAQQLMLRHRGPRPRPCSTTMTGGAVTVLPPSSSRSGVAQAPASSSVDVREPGRSPADSPFLCTRLWMTCAKRQPACGQAGKYWGLRWQRASMSWPSPGKTPFTPCAQKKS